MITLSKNGFTVNNCLSMPFSKMPLALNAYLRRVPKTSIVESAAMGYAATGFKQAQTMTIVQDICLWGGNWGPYILSRISNGNSAQTICNHLKAGFHAPTSIAAIKSVRHIFGLSVSFGSKHLRMLDPSRYAVLDSLLAPALGYPLDNSGFDNLCNDCRVLSAKLTALGIKNPMDAHYLASGLSNPRNSGTHWWPADVEMCLFAEVHPKNWSSYSTRSDMSPDSRMTATGSITSHTQTYATPTFDDFWDWLRVRRSVSTLCGRSIVNGQSDQSSLRITTSNNASILPILRATVRDYCEQIFWSDFHGLKGNVRWVAAFLSEYLGRNK